MASGEREAEGATDETAVSLDIPEFITIVAEQVREAVRRFERTGHAPLLYLSGLQLQVAFTAEESSDRNGKIELKPWIVSLSRGKKETQSQQVVHSVTLNLTTGG